MFFILLLLQFYTLFGLLVHQLLLLFLILLVKFRIAGVWRGRALRSRQVVGVNGRMSTILGVRFGSASIRGRMIFASGFTRCHNRAVEVTGTSRRSDRRPPLIDGSPQVAVRACRLNVLILRRNGTDVMISIRRFIRRRRPRCESTLAAVEAYMAVVDNGDMLVIDVVDVDHVDVGKFPVIKEVAVLPPSPNKTVAEVAEAVVDSAIEADMRPPEAIME